MQPIYMIPQASLLVSRLALPFLVHQKQIFSVPKCNLPNGIAHIEGLQTLKQIIPILTSRLRGKTADEMKMEDTLTKTIFRPVQEGIANCVGRPARADGMHTGKSQTKFG